jgi:hypothetical protein
MPGFLVRKPAIDVAGVLLVAEREHADARGLRHAAEIRDRDARHAVDRGEAVELERIDDEVEAVGQLSLFLGRGFFLQCRFRHGVLPKSFAFRPPGAYARASASLRS